MSEGGITVRDWISKLSLHLGGVRKPLPNNEMSRMGVGRFQAKLAKEQV